MLNAVNSTTIDAANSVKASYDATAAERNAVSTAELLPVDVDIPTAVTNVCPASSRTAETGPLPMTTNGGTTTLEYPAPARVICARSSAPSSSGV